MKSTKSKIRNEIDDEETPSIEILERRKDRKLKDDITNMMVGVISLLFCQRRSLYTRPLGLIFAI